MIFFSSLRQIIYQLSQIDRKLYELLRLHKISPYREQEETERLKADQQSFTNEKPVKAVKIAKNRLYKIKREKTVEDQVNSDIKAAKEALEAYKQFVKKERRKLRKLHGTLKPGGTLHKKIDLQSDISVYGGKYKWSMRQVQRISSLKPSGVPKVHGKKVRTGKSGVDGRTLSRPASSRIQRKRVFGKGGSCL